MQKDSKDWLENQPGTHVNFELSTVNVNAVLVLYQFKKNIAVGQAFLPVRQECLTHENQTDTLPPFWISRNIFLQSCNVTIHTRRLMEQGY